MRHGKVDLNQPAVVKAIRAIGGEVQHLHEVGRGCPDLLVAFRQRWYVIEVKSDDGELNEDQKKWATKFPAPVYVVRSAEQAIEFLTRQTPDWLLGLEVKAMRATTHVCEGPPNNERLDDIGPAVKNKSLTERVVEVLSKSGSKLSMSEVCDRLSMSKSSQFTYRTLRELVRRDRIKKTGSKKGTLYWIE